MRSPVSFQTSMTKNIACNSNNFKIDFRKWKEGPLINTALRLLKTNAGRVISHSNITT